MTPLRFWLTFVAVLVSLPLATPTALAQTEDTESGAETEDARFEPAGLAAAAGRYRAALVAKRPAQPSPAAADAALKAAARPSRRIGSRRRSHNWRLPSPWAARPRPCSCS